MKDILLDYYVSKTQEKEKTELWFRMNILSGGITSSEVLDSRQQQVYPAGTIRNPKYPQIKRLSEQA